MEIRAIERGVEVLKARAPKAARRMNIDEDMVVKLLSFRSLCVG
jgi:hypothetical protein